MVRNMMDELDVTARKRQIRKQILARRNEMPFPERVGKSRWICDTLMHTDNYRKTGFLLAYVDYQSEVITKPLLEAALMEGKSVFVPKVEGEDMEFYQINDLSQLTEGYKGIREPVGGMVFDCQEEEPLMVMPGAVFDKQRHRIGYGKGFYDRYLEHLAKRNINVHTMALCFACQMLDEIPYEEHDIRPDMILTEEGMYD